MHNELKEMGFSDFDISQIQKVVNNANTKYDALRLELAKTIYLDALEINEDTLLLLNDEKYKTKIPEELDGVAEVSFMMADAFIKRLKMGNE